jgi:hypothetical protein
MALPIEKPAMWALDTSSAQQRGGVVGHRGRREVVPLSQRRAFHTAIVEGGDEVAVR